PTRSCWAISTVVRPTSRRQTSTRCAAISEPCGTGCPRGPSATTTTPISRPRSQLPDPHARRSQGRILGERLPVTRQRLGRIALLSIHVPSRRRRHAGTGKELRRKLQQAHLILRPPPARLTAQQVHERQLAEIVRRAAVVAAAEISIASRRSREPGIGEVERDLISEEPRARHSAMTGLALHYH